MGRKSNGNDRRRFSEAIYRDKRLAQVFETVTHHFIPLSFFLFVRQYVPSIHANVTRETDEADFAFATELATGCFAARIDHRPIIVRTSGYLLPPR